MYTQEELQKAAERLAAADTSYLGKTLYEGEGHKVVVRPYFHGAVDTGLFYLINEDERPYSDKFLISNMETGESDDLKYYIEKVLPCQIERWEGARKEKEREEQEARERAEYERFKGFTDSMTTCSVDEMRRRSTQSPMTQRRSHSSGANGKKHFLNNDAVIRTKALFSRWATR